MGTKILPAILEHTQDNVVSRIKSTDAQHVHIDVVHDLHEITSTWPYISIEQRRVFSRLVAQKNGSSVWENRSIDVHLMMGYPSLVIRQWVDLGARRIIVQADNIINARSALRLLQQYRKKTGVEGVIAVVPTDDIKTIEPFLKLIDSVLVMGIEKIGEQGHPFNPQALDLLHKIKIEYPHLNLGIDGGITSENAIAAKEAGADWIVVGSGIFKKQDPDLAYHELQTLVE